mmetsp:Transcript_22910/g.50459  ORF Transcript_22910/g.50459 Transcript_22910/m.50459 type:complete len:454 (+) Transcript_22910:564-1925(+)
MRRTTPSGAPSQDTSTKSPWAPRPPWDPRWPLDPPQEPTLLRPLAALEAIQATPPCQERPLQGLPGTRPLCKDLLLPTRRRRAQATPHHSLPPTRQRRRPTERHQCSTRHPLLGPDISSPHRWQGPLKGTIHLQLEGHHLPMPPLTPTSPTDHPPRTAPHRHQTPTLPTTTGVRPRTGPQRQVRTRTRHHLRPSAAPSPTLRGTPRQAPPTLRRAPRLLRPPAREGRIHIGRGTIHPLSPVRLPLKVACPRHNNNHLFNNSSSSPHPSTSSSTSNNSPHPSSSNSSSSHRPSTLSSTRPSSISSRHRRVTNSHRHKTTSSRRRNSRSSHHPSSPNNSRHPSSIPRPGRHLDPAQEDRPSLMAPDPTGPRHQDLSIPTGNSLGGPRLQDQLATHRRTLDTGPIRIRGQKHADADEDDADVGGDDSVMPLPKVPISGPQLAEWARNEQSWLQRGG